MSPVRRSRPLGDGDRPALVIGGTARIRAGDVTVFCKVVAVAQARVRRDGRVQAQGSPAEHATLGPAEEWLDRQAGTGVIDQVAGRAARGLDQDDLVFYHAAKRPTNCMRQLCH